MAKVRCLKKYLYNGKAFTLIELMLAISITLLISTVLTKILLTSTKTSSDLTNQTYAQKTVRLGLSYIRKDLATAVSIFTPAVGTDPPASELMMRGLAQKNKTMVLDGITPNTYEPAGEIQEIWLASRKANVYVDGVGQDAGFTVHYDQGKIEFDSPQGGTITADFTYDIKVQYRLANEDLKRFLGNDADSNNVIEGAEVISQKTIAANITDNEIFNRVRNNLIYVKLESNNYNLISAMNVFTGGASGFIISDESFKLNTPRDLTALHFTSSNNGWVSDVGGFVTQYGLNGATYEWLTPIPLNTSSNRLNDVYFVSESLGWAVGNDGRIFEYNGTWDLNTKASGTTDNLYGVAASDGNDVVSIGGGGTSGTSTSFNGTAWSVNVPDSSITNVMNGVDLRIGVKYAAGNLGQVYKADINQITGDGSDGALVVDGTTAANNTLDGAVITGGPFNSSTPLVIDTKIVRTNRIYNFSSVTLQNGALLTHSNAAGSGTSNPGIGFKVQGSVVVNAGTSINLNYRGYSAGSGPGAGAVRAGGSAYSDELGSGGASAGGAGGTGGGRIKIIANSVVLGGTITANGSNGTYVWGYNGGAGGGAGGQIHIIGVTDFSGLSNISATGGSGASYGTRILCGQSYSHGGGGGGSGGNGGSGGTGSVAGGSGCTNEDGGGGGGGGGRVIVEAPIAPAGAATLTGGSFGVGWGTPENGLPGGNGIYSYVAFAGATIKWNLAYDAGNMNFNSANIVADSENASEYFLSVAGDNGEIYQYGSALNYWDDKNDKGGVDVRPTTQKLNAIYFFDDKNGWAVGDAGTILNYDYYMDQWLEIPSVTANNLNDIFLYSKDEGYIVGDNGTLLKISR